MQCRAALSEHWLHHQIWIAGMVQEAPNIPCRRRTLQALTIEIVVQLASQHKSYRTEMRQLSVAILAPSLKGVAEVEGRPSYKAAALQFHYAPAR